MTTTYKMTGFYGKHTPVDMVVTDVALAEWQKDAHMRIDSVVPCVVEVTYRTADGCARCATDAYVPHYNCIYGGRRIGHSASHCTADACY